MFYTQTKNLFNIFYNTSVLTINEGSDTRNECIGRIYSGNMNFSVQK